MAQNKLLDPIVSSPAVLTGAGNGTLTVDRLTHFTITQDYTATCIQISPSTVFSIVGSLDGPVGLATVGTQFIDSDLKIFLTIQQGVTPFQVGDEFELSVEQGTDLSQDNIDDYDELPQKNFGLGNRGASSGDHNIRYSNNSRKAKAYHQDLFFEAVVAGNGGNLIQVQYTPGTAGSEVASALGNLISVTMEDGKSTAQQILTAILAAPTVTALINASLIGVGSNPQFDSGTIVSLSGGKDKQFALNHDEITDSGDFVEGNASVLAKDVTAQGNANVTGHAKVGGTLSLEDVSSDNRSGEKIANVQQHINRLIQDQKTLLKTADDSKISWASPNLSFTDDLVIYFSDTGFQNTVPVAESPISIADGESLYVVLDRFQNKILDPFVSASVPTIINAYRIASRIGDSLILNDNTLVRNGKSARIGEGGGAGGLVYADLYDPVSTVLPSGPSATIDGVSVTNGMFVLFSNLSSGNNQIYEVSGVGVSLVWTPQTAFENGLLPYVGEQVIIAYGTAFALAVGVFDSSTFDFNSKVRYFNGVDYWEISNIQIADLMAATTDDVFSITASGSENIIVDFSILRGSVKEVGTLHIVTDGSTASVSQSGTTLSGSSGITFTADISMGNIRLRYTADAGVDATMKFTVKRWSDGPGGPGGVPSYSGGSSATVAGADTEIQFNDSGNFGADPDFTWDKNNNVLGLSGLQIAGLSSGITLFDSTTNGTVFTYDAATYPFVIIEYSIERGTARELGRLMIVNDGTVVNLSGDFVDTAVSGVTFSAIISGSDVELQYTTIATGFDATFKYSVRRWS